MQKCVAAPKTKTKDLATQICLMYCEAEAHEKVVEQLLGGFANKNPKVSFHVIISFLTMCLGCFRMCDECDRMLEEFWSQGY